MKKILTLVAFSAVGFALQSASASNILYDGNFQAIGDAGGNNQSFYSGTPVAGWQTSNPAGLLEIWDDSVVIGYNPPSGSNYFAEMNANVQASLWQVVTAPDTNPFDIYFSHRGRGGVDTAGLSIYSLGAATSWSQASPGTLLWQTKFSSGSAGWSNYSANNIATPVAGQNYAMVFDSISSANGNASYGNLIGDVRFGDAVYASSATPLTLQSFSTGYSSGLGAGAAVPEPGTWAAAALLAGGAGFARWRKRAKTA